MIPVLYPATERTFSNNGLGGLPNATKCTVTKKRNTPGGYYLEMEYPIDGLHYKDLAVERIIYASPEVDKHPQPFRVERISRPMNGIVTVYAPHVSAALQKAVTYGTYTNKLPSVAIDYFLGRIIPVSEREKWTIYYPSNYKVDDNRTVTFNEPVSMMDVLMGVEGSLLDTFGGEYDFDHWTIKVERNLGKDTGIEVRYGVNMVDMNAETDASELITAVVPYWSGTVDNTDTVVIGDQCTSKNAASFSYTRCVPLDVSQEFDSSDTAPTKEQVTAKGQAFINKSTRSSIPMSLDVQYIPITEDIGARNISLFDTVKVVHPDLGVSATEKVVETQFNVLTERYDKITIGSIKQSIVDTIAKMIKKG